MFGIVIFINPYKADASKSEVDKEKKPIFRGRGVVTLYNI